MAAHGNHRRSVVGVPVVEEQPVIGQCRLNRLERHRRGQAQSFAPAPGVAPLEQSEYRCHIGASRQTGGEARVEDLALVVQEVGPPRRDPDSLPNPLDGVDRLVEVGCGRARIHIGPSEPVERLPYLFGHRQCARELERCGEVRVCVGHRTGAPPRLAAVDERVRHLPLVAEPRCRRERLREGPLGLVEASEVDGEHDSTVLEHAELAVGVPVLHEQSPGAIVHVERLDGIAEPAVQDAQVHEQLRLLAWCEIGRRPIEFAVEGEGRLIAPEPLLQCRLVRQQDPPPAGGPVAIAVALDEAQRLVVEPRGVSVLPGEEVDVAKVAELLSPCVGIARRPGGGEGAPECRIGRRVTSLEEGRQPGLVGGGRGRARVTQHG